MDRDQKNFNSYTPSPSTDPYESWRWNGIRPVTRNKLISLAAHATAQMIYPKAFAQNKNDEEDRAAAEVMEDLIEYHIHNSDYELSFLYGIVSMLVNPVVYMSPEFSETMQTIKEMDENGKISKKEVIDGVMSGFQVNVIPPDEILIANPYEYYHQRQRFIIRKKFIDYDEAQARYGEHENFKHVQPGVKVLYDNSTSTFYEQYDSDLETLVEEVTYRNRREDMEVCFLNGVYMGDKNIDANLIKHRDTEGRPKYAEAKSGYEPIDEKRFYYYKSAASKFSNDQTLVNDLWQLRMDNTLMQGQPPIFVSGNVKFNSSTVMPRAVTAVGKDVTITPVNTGGRIDVIDSAIAQVDQSISDSSQDRLRAGVSDVAGRTAREVMLAEKNAAITQGIFKKMISSLVSDFGDLMVEGIVQHETVASVEDILGEETKTKYKTFLMESTDNGSKVTKKIIFDPGMIGKEYTENELMAESQSLMDQEMKDGKKKIYKVNPEAFRELKYKIIIAPDELNPLSTELERALNLEAYDRLIMNPLITQNPENFESVTRDFLLEAVAKGKGDKYLKKPQPAAQPMGIQAPGTPGQPNMPLPNPPQGGAVGRIMGSNSMNQMKTTV